ncbi:MAG: type II 3-dehydroquinate dehydratase [Desulfarculaceae bacterium]|jgi:3-dehydroquinate dehydratase-2
MRVMIINGPNLNMLGRREPQLYGSLTLEQINQKLESLAGDLGLECHFVQSNHEGELVDALQKAAEETQGVVLNAGAYTHTSVALRDAVLCCSVPVVEVHLTNPLGREDFRRVSLLAGACSGSVSGFGWHSYALAFLWLAKFSSPEKNQAL